MIDASFLSTSATISQVAEAFALPESSVTITIGQDLLPDLTDALTDTVGSALTTTSLTASQLLATPTNVVAPLVAGTGPTAPVASVGSATPGIDPQQLVPQQVGDAASLATLTGLSLLQQLSLLPSDGLAGFVSGHPEAVQALIDSPPAAREVQLWWTALDIDARSDMLTQAPNLVGNLEGVPFSLRDLANRTYLTNSIAALSAESGGGRCEALEASARLSMLM